MLLRTTIITFGVFCLMSLPMSVGAMPPDHAPAHGYRAKHDQQKHGKGKHDKHKHDRARHPEERERPSTPEGGIEIVFDSERGIYVGVDLPQIIFHSDHYYRETAGRWQVSLNGRGEWRFAAASSIPQIVVEAGGTSKDARRSLKQDRTYPGPAKLWWVRGD
jgi:hypothetical protein